MLAASQQLRQLTLKPGPRALILVWACFVALGLVETACLRTRVCTCLKVLCVLLFILLVSIRLKGGCPHQG
eukprot:5338695-Amphidinium_carterae.1